LDAQAQTNYVGGIQGGTTNGAEIYIDDLRFYNRTLSDDEVYNISNIDIGSNMDIRFANKTVANIPTLDNDTLISIGLSDINDVVLSNNCLFGEVVGTNCRSNFTIDSIRNATVSIGIFNASYSYGLDNCSNSYNIPSNATALNISFYDEDDDSVYIDYEATISYWYNSSNLYNYSLAIDNINFTQLCVYPSWANLTSNIQIEYIDSDTNIYDYFVYETYLNNQTQILNLYTQNETTQVLFTVQTLDTAAVENAYIHILKYDVGTGAYTTTEVIKTDSQGQAIGNIILATTFYNFLVYYNGELIYTEQGVKLIATTRTFTVNLEGDDWLDNFGTTLGVNTNLYFNDATQNFVYTWSDPSESIHYGCLRVDKTNDSGKYNLSNTCTESVSATIIYNIPLLENGTDYIGTGYLRFDDMIITNRVVKSIAAVRDFFRQDPIGSLFIGFLFCLTMLLIGIPNPVLSSTLLGFGIILTSTLGLYAISGMQLGSIIMLILIQIYLAGRQTT